MYVSHVFLITMSGNTNSIMEMSNHIFPKPTDGYIYSLNQPPEDEIIC